MIDGLGLRVQVGQPEPGQSARDLMALSAMLDRFALTGKPIALTAVGAPSATPESAGAPELASRKPGHWRSPWSEASQADWATAALSVAAAKPYVQSVCWHELYDVPQPAEMPRGGLIDVASKPKRVAGRIADLTKALREPRLPVDLDPDVLLARQIAGQSVPQSRNS